MMLIRCKQNISLPHFLSSLTRGMFILRTLPVLFTIYCMTGCYTMLTPPPGHIRPQENQSINDEVDSPAVTNQQINNYYCSSCGIYANSCSSIHWRYNSWTGTYYCDPYYYNYSYYNHHYNDNYWWHSNQHWDYYDYSDNYSYSPSKKTRRDRSFVRTSDDTVVENSQHENTGSSLDQSDTYNAPADNSNSITTGYSTATTQSQANNSNTKPRRKHNRKPL